MRSNIVIGAIHLPPLLGYPDFPGIKIALRYAFQDLRALERGGVSAIIFENNYDIPHVERVSSAVAACLTYVGAELKRQTKLPLGISVLWNDYETALSIAKVLDLQFVRVPVFVDKVKTSYGIMDPQAKRVTAYRQKIGAHNVALLTDIHVKHATILSKHSITESARRAITAGSDGLIVTGKWTGDAPNLDEIKSVRKTVGNFPIVVGSGLDAKNARDLLSVANGAIVSTALKSGTINRKEVNLKPYQARISQTMTRQLVQILK